jgi:octaprenyl-diphosphate synthase
LKIIEKIKEPIAKEFEIFETEFKNSVNSGILILNVILKFMINRKGKQVRPILVLLFAKMYSSENLTEKSYRSAIISELIHSATLIHDDIIDDSSLRRGFLSINALWNNKISVLVGDYLLSKSLLLCIDNEDFDLLKIISTAVKEMSEGELLQIQKSRNINITEDEYFELTLKKTASLFSACCKLGLASTGLKNLNKVEEFGQNLGLIFQIKDDLFDYSYKRIGKPTAIDIKNQKITLPLIYTLNKVNTSDKKFIIESYKNKRKLNKNKNKIYSIIEQNGGFKYAFDKMLDLKEKNLLIINNFPKNESRESLKLMLEYLINRKF